MANRIQIRHGNTRPKAGIHLLPYELGWDGDNLYINNNQSSNQECIIIATAFSNEAIPLAHGGTGATTAAAARTNLGLGSIAVKATTDFLPVNYTAPDFSVATTTQGVYPLTGVTHPVSGSTEYGGVLQFGGSTTARNYYAAQLVVSSPSGASSPPHAYIRRMVSTPAWSVWSTLLDNNNYSTYALPLTGGTITGPFKVERDIGGVVVVKNTTTEAEIQLTTNSSSNWQGIWSRGYWDGTAYVSSSKWLLYRDTNDNVILNGNANTSNKIITASDSTSRSVYVTTTNAVPSGAVAGDIVLVKVS